MIISRYLEHSAYHRSDTGRDESLRSVAGETVILVAGFPVAGGGMDVRLDAELLRSRGLPASCLAVLGCHD